MANEKRLIYAEDALVGLQYISMFGDVNDNMIQGAMRLARSKIENAPTVDAIPVTEIEAYLQERLGFTGLVHCKECKHFAHNLENDTFCRCVNGLSDPTENCFCSYGERK